MCIDLNSLLIKLIMLTPISMLIQRQFDAVNKLVVGLIFVLLVFCNLLNKHIRKNTFILMLFGCLIFVYSFINVDRQYFSINMLFYYPIWILYLCYSVDCHDNLWNAFYKNKSFIRLIIWLWSILVVISFFLPSSYNAGEFQSFTTGNFRFAPTVFFMSVIIWAYAGYFNKKKYMYFMIIPFVAMIATGSRTYTIILLILISLAFYSFFKNKKNFIVMMIPCMLLVINVLYDSAFTEKFSRAMGNQYVSDPLAALTSNRSVFWLGEIKMFLHAGIIEKLLGGGLTASYVKNVKITGQAIWAHNDFLEMINAHGLLGLIVYTACFFKYYKFAKKIHKYKKSSSMVFILCCFLNAFFNGLYVYTTATLAIPFFGYAVTVDYSKSSKNIER